MTISSAPSNTCPIPDAPSAATIITSSRRAQFWFIEALVYLVLVATALIAVPGVDRWSGGLPVSLRRGSASAG
ncbi:hypothetical protein [Micromonospora sp. MS34]|uniref:hypothetical protein n=1 Tax=Micromonospora sp. MS34 TaxID=3385971 RepID=UPI0039A2C684